MAAASSIQHRTALTLLVPLVYRQYSSNAPTQCSNGAQLLPVGSITARTSEPERQPAAVVHNTAKSGAASLQNQTSRMNLVPCTAPCSLLRAVQCSLSAV